MDLEVHLVWTLGAGGSLNIGHGRENEDEKATGSGNKNPARSTFGFVEGDETEMKHESDEGRIGLG